MPPPTTTTTTTTTTTRRPRITRPPARAPYDPRYQNGLNPYFTTRKPYYNGQYPMHPKQKHIWKYNHHHKNTEHETGEYKHNFYIQTVLLI